MPLLAKPAACHGCPFEHIGLGFVPPEGPADAHVRVCGEAPGADEVDAGRPFVGPSGAMLKRGLKFAGLGEPCTACIDKPRSWGCEVCSGVGKVFPEILIYNTIQCRPPDNDYSLVPPGTVGFCQSAHVAPVPEGDNIVTVLVGGSSLVATFPQLTSIDRWRGSRLPLTSGGTAVPTLHPAGVMRGQWHKLPLIAADVEGAVHGVSLSLPIISSSISASAEVIDLALDVETEAEGGIDIVGVSIDGLHVWQTSRPQEIQFLLDRAQRIWAHNAQFDVTKLRFAGLRINDSKIMDSMLSHHMCFSDLDVGLDDAMSIHFPGQWTWHKALWGSHWSDEDIEICRAIWRQIWPEAEAIGWYRAYNALDVVSCWHIGQKTMEILNG